MIKNLLDLKARIRAHENRDDERESLRTDSAVAFHTSFRLIYSLAMIFNLVLGKIDIRGAYNQSGDDKSDVNVRPPQQLRGLNKLWLLIMTINGVVSAGRKWQRASDAFMIDSLGISLSWSLSWVFNNCSIIHPIS